MKFATHVVLFGQDKWIMRNIANAYTHVDKIYVAYSNFPWGYNPLARRVYINSFDLNILTSSEYADKIHIIKGDWLTEEDQRNACAEQAAKDNMDFLLIHDADEFYFHKDFDKIIKHIIKHPNYDYYKIGWYCFWKDFNYILLDVSGNILTGYPEFAINLKNGVRFISKRRPNKTNFHTIPNDVGICYHGSYVLTDKELYQKINTWGHTNDFNKDQWYEEKWLKWTPDMRDLHLVSPSAWSKAVLFPYPLPEVIADMR